jgi:hypothetical protein
MDGMRPPQLPDQPVDVVRAEHLTRLLRICEGRDFASRRDTTIILLLLVDTGMPRAECAGLTLDDVDLDQRIVWVLGKGRRPRALPIGRKPLKHSIATCGPGMGMGWAPPAATLGRPQRAHDPFGHLRPCRCTSSPPSWPPSARPAGAVRRPGGRQAEINRFLGVITGAVPIDYFTPRNLLRLLGVRGMATVMLSRLRQPRPATAPRAAVERP